MIGLTARQKDCLHVIQRELAINGIPPSFEEIKDKLGLKSMSGVHRLITGLEERGYINRLPNRARSIELGSATSIRLSVGLMFRARSRAAKRGQSLDSYAAEAIEAMLECDAEMEADR